MSPGYRLEHVERMCDALGMHEHALVARPRMEHGYCTDDNARLLIMLSGEPTSDTTLRLSELSLQFLIDAQDPTSGLVRNRKSPEGAWLDGFTDGDWWGRAVWGMGVAAARHPDPQIRARALAGFECSARVRTMHAHAAAFAALGAVEVLSVGSASASARGLLTHAAALLDVPTDPAWPFPLARLTYANAAIAEALMACGEGLDRPDLVSSGLSMLIWQLQLQLREGHLSVVPVGGLGPDEAKPLFDQQSIEVLALADASWRAWRLTREPQWSDAVLLCRAWFIGDNDLGVQMFDERTGGGFDGLTPSGPNINQGAESTLAYIGTMQRAGELLEAVDSPQIQALVPAPPVAQASRAR